MNQLPGAVLDYQLDTRGSTRRHVTHVIHDPDLPPSTPPRFEVWERDKEPIGEGGQGRVFLQRCMSGGRHYTIRAVKVIRSEDEGGKHRYLRELEAMIRFSHQNYSKFFVRMLGWYLAGRNICIAMEYLPEGDLHSYLRDRSALAEEDSRQVISQVLQGLAIMHKVGIAHRDVKPQNILINQRPTPTGPDSWWVKLADFGISKRTDSTITAATEAIGTMDYMAPEVLFYEDETPNIDYKAADIWSLGATAFYILTKSRNYLRWRTIHSDTPPIDNVLPNDSKISPSGRAFLVNLMLPDPSKRPECHEAMRLQWVESYIPSSTNMSTTENQFPPSPSSSSWSSVSDDEELATLATRITDTLLGNIPEPENKPKPVNKPPKVPPRSQPITQVKYTENTGTAENVSIYNAAQNGDLEVVKSLVHNIETLDDKGLSALYYAASNGKTQVVEFLLNHGAKPDVLMGEKSTPFHAAIWNGHLDVAELFINRKADLGCRDGDERTPLHAAARRGYASTVMLLVQNGADIDAQNSAGATPLSEAVYQNAVDVVIFLAGEGANATTKNKIGDEPAHIAASNGYTQVLKVLLSLGTDINTIGSSERTLVYAAAVGGHKETIKLLADRGADLEKASSTGHSPLEAAIYFGNTEAARLLHDEVAVARTKTDKFKSLVINTGCTPYAPFPSQLKIHETVIRGKKYIGSEANRKLYRIRASQQRAVAGTVSLHNGSSESATVMAQGGNIPGTLHEFIRIAILPDQVGTTIILRADLLDDEQTVRFYFRTYKKDDSGSSTEQPLDFEWRIKQGEFSQSDAHELTLFQQHTPGSTDDNVNTDPIATAKISHPAGGYALPFELSIEKTMDNPTVVTVIMTALLIGLRYNNGTATKSHVRAKLGYKD